MSFNPWHDVEIGEKSPEIVESIIEIPQGSKAKYEIDEETGMLRLDRVLYSSMRYPTNYGFIPQTYGEDNDPLDIVVLSQIHVQPLCLISARVIGVLNMVDGGEADEKIIAVANDDVAMDHIQSLDDLSDHWKDEFKNFFEDYKKLEKKETEINGIDGKEKAVKIIEEAIERYNKKFK